MATLDFSRAYHVDIVTFKGMKFNPALAFSRTDSNDIDWTGKTLKMDIRHKFSELIVTWTGGVEFTVATAILTFDIVPQEDSADIERGIYYYELYNDTDDIPIAYGEFKII